MSATLHSVTRLWEMCSSSACRIRARAARPAVASPTWAPPPGLEQMEPGLMLSGTLEPHAMQVVAEGL